MDNLLKFLPLAIILISGAAAFTTVQSDVLTLVDENKERKQEIKEIRENKLELVTIKERLKSIEKRQDLEYTRQSIMLENILSEVKK